MDEVFDADGPAEGDGIFGLPHGPDEARVWLLPVPFDATASFRKGAARGPEAIATASRQVDLHDPVTGRPFERGIWMAPLDPGVAAWNEEASRRDHLGRVNEIGAELNEWVRGHTAQAIAAGKLCGTVGGEHSVSFGAIQAHAEHYPGMGVLHVDAHADLREAYEGLVWSHASVLHNVLERVDGIGPVLQVGLRDLGGAELERLADPSEGVHAVFDHEWAETRFAARNLQAFVRRALAVLPRDVYVTVDVDGLDPSLCPNTGTPVPGGLEWNEAMLWLGELVATGRRIVGFDLVEVAPGAERPPGEGIDEIVGARLLYRLIGYALQSRL